jgi:hypothetical protein
MTKGDGWQFPDTGEGLSVNGLAWVAGKGDNDV